jgi:hypothetical protein
MGGRAGVRGCVAGVSSLRGWEEVAEPVGVIGASYVTSDQLKLAGPADRVAAASGR